MLIPNSFYSFVCQVDYYSLLNSTKLKFQDAAEIARSYADDANNFQQLQQFLKKNARLYRFAYANLFPKYFSRSDDYGIHSKLEFENFLKNWISQKNLSMFGWQYSVLNVKTEENLSEISNLATPLNDEKIDFKKIEVEDRTAKEKIKRKRKNNPPSEKKIKKRSEKKQKLEADLKKNDEMFSQINYKKIDKL